MHPLNTRSRAAAGGRLLAAGLLLVLVASGCASGDEDGTDDSGSPLATETTSPDDEQTTAGEDQAFACTPGGTLTIGMPGDINGFDPVKMAGPMDEMVAWPIYDRLLYLPTPFAEPEPLLAESLEPNEDLTEWTMTLKEGITFSDGEPFNAEAAKFNIDRHLDPDNGSQARAVITPIEEIEVVDDTTLVFHLSIPWANLPVALTFLPTAMASPAAVDASGDDYTRNPVGTGPYTLEEWVPGDHITLQKRDDYWREDAGFPDTITLRVIPEGSTRFDSLQTGDVDLITSPQAEDIVTVQGGGDLVFRQAPEGVPTQPIIAFNHNNAPVDDVRVRQALSYAVDRVALSEAVSEGLEEPSTGPFAGSTWDTGVEYPGHDAARAQALVDEYESETGEQIAFTYQYIAPGGQEQAGVLQAMWANVGMDVEIEGMDVPTYLQTLASGEYTAKAFSSSIAPHPDMVFYAFMKFGSPLQLHKVEDPRMEEALEAARSSADPAAQTEAYSTIDQIMADEVFWAWLTTGIAGYIHSPDVKGSGLDPEMSWLATSVPNLTSEICLDR